MDMSDMLEGDRDNLTKDKMKQIYLNLYTER